MKTTGVSNIPKLGLLVFLGHPSIYTCTSEEKVGAGQRVAAAYSEETVMNKEKTPNLIVFNHIVFFFYI